MTRANASGAEQPAVRIVSGGRRGRGSGCRGGVGHRQAWRREGDPRRYRARGRSS